MPPSAQSHSRSHSLLLLQKLLNLRDSASPLTLVLDTLEETARPVIQEFITRAKISKSKIIYVSFVTLKKPAHVDCFVKARQKSAETLRSEIISHYPSGAPGHAHKVLLLVDTLNPLASTAPSHLASFLGSLITPAVSLVATYHTDVPLGRAGPASEYEPHPLAVLSHLATAVLRVSSVHQAVERRRARDRSLAEPGFGLAEGREGVLVGLGSRDRALRTDVGGLVLDMELRRRSGRSVAESFVLVPAKAALGPKAEAARISLVRDHPLLGERREEADEEGTGEEEVGTTFSLGLTEKQRRDREGIVLPYFDAQTDIGAGEGGRILYEMGREDDFDDEEDEI